MGIIPTRGIFYWCLRSSVAFAFSCGYAGVMEVVVLQSSGQGAGANCCCLSRRHGRDWMRIGLQT